jgi:hydrogenase expression/formation protein HypD
VKYLAEFRQPELAMALARAIKNRCRRPLRLMEVCGTHTMAIFRHGIKSLLPPQLELISGPGCPVCVTPPEEVERAIRIASLPGVILASFGDMLKVPGVSTSLAGIRSQGADVRVVYSPLEALVLARDNPKQTVVLYGVGFETTAPAVAATMLAARREGLDNLRILSVHKLIPPALGALLADTELNIDGFLCPGHVSSIIGAKSYEFIGTGYRKPAVISGFEPVDILESILRLVNQHEAGEARVEIQYQRAVSPQGNLKAQQVMQQVFEVTDARWRGLGLIPASGLKIKPEWIRFDALRHWDIQLPPLAEPPGCICGQVLRGVSRPPECPLFGDGCTPEAPVGPCMVSSEGSCAAYYKYQAKQ